MDSVEVDSVMGHEEPVTPLTLKDIFNPDMNVTREKVFELSISHWNSNVHMIRKSLGFRHVGPDTARRPKFQSEAVSKLYDEIHQLAIDELPVESLDALRQAWKDGTIIREEIRKLISTYRKDIWDLAPDRRDLAQNPRSPLKVVSEGEDEFYPVNLFPQIETHREFIALQLEHLAFAKAECYHRNHFQNASSEKPRKPANAEKAYEPSKTRADRASAIAHKAAGPRWSLVVKLKLSRSILLGMGLTPRKRKRDKRTDQPYGLRRKKIRKNASPAQATKKASVTVPNLLLDDDRALSDIDEDDSELPIRRAPPKASARARRIPDTPLSDSPLLGSSEDMSNKRAGMDEEQTPERVHLEESQVRASPHAGNLSPVASPVAVEAEDASGEDLLASQREKLGSLLLREFLDVCPPDEEFDEFDQADFAQDPLDMIRRSKEITELLESIWKATETLTKEKFSAEEFKQTNTIVSKWILWRKLGMKLAEIQSFHPLQRGTRPTLTHEQWTDRLGGLPNLNGFRYRLELRREWFTQPETTLGSAEVSHLATAMMLAASTKDTLSREYYVANITEFNRRLSPWFHTCISS